MKKQFVVIVSIAVISLLVGTMLSMNYLVVGGKPPSVWDAIYALQNKVNSIDGKLNQTKTIRFYEPNETMNHAITYVDGAVFVWTPSDITNNAILSINCYFQYRCEPEGLRFRIVVNDESDPTGIAWLVSSEYIWSYVVPNSALSNGGLTFTPNQDSYTIRFQFASHNGLVSAYVKDINVILTVADGLSPYNP